VANQKAEKPATALSGKPASEFDHRDGMVDSTRNPTPITPKEIYIHAEVSGSEKSRAGRHEPASHFGRISIAKAVGIGADEAEVTEIVIILLPSFDRRGKRRHGQFDVRLKDSGEMLLVATRQPLLDASRTLIRRGLDPSNVICKVRSDAPTVVTMRAPIGVAAQYDVMGDRFVRRKPDAGPMPASGTENLLSAGPVTPCSTKATLRASHKGAAKTPAPSSSASPSPTSTTTGEN
jgi:hypothetical protein